MYVVHTHHGWEVGPTSYDYNRCREECLKMRVQHAYKDCVFEIYKLTNPNEPPYLVGTVVPQDTV